MAWARKLECSGSLQALEQLPELMSQSWLALVWLALWPMRQNVNQCGKNLNP
jgi:hypothetical protein